MQMRLHSVTLVLWWKLALMVNLRVRGLKEASASHQTHVFRVANLGDFTTKSKLNIWQWCMDLVNLNKQLFVQTHSKEIYFYSTPAFRTTGFFFFCRFGCTGSTCEATDVGFLVIWQKLNFTGVSHEASNLFASAVIIVACRHNQIFTASKRVSKCTQHFSMFITDARATPPTCACRPARWGAVLCMHVAHTQAAGAAPVSLALNWVRPW